MYMMLRLFLTATKALPVRIILIRLFAIHLASHDTSSCRSAHLSVYRMYMLS